ncbi:MAG: TetR/AcrR family transcriptional regulator [Bacteroidota bacterium]
MPLFDRAKNIRTLARPITFDKTKVIHQIKDAFWKKGFAYTSIEDLEKATGLKRTSLYAAYGDKMKMYLSALATYKEESNAQAERMFNASNNPIDRIEKLLKTSVINGTSKGCFIVNAGTERYQQCPSTTQFIDDNTQAALENFKQQLKEAQQQNLLSANANIEVLAHQIFVLNLGIMAGLKNGLSKDELFETIDATLAAMFA